MKAAYFREEWLDKANQLLSDPSLRANFYECLMCRAFGRELPTFRSDIVAAMYTMAESAIAQDIAKYEAKCERNRENALKRVAASGNQSQRVVASGSDGNQSLPNTNTNTNTNTSTNTSSSTSTISLESIDSEREKYLIYCTLFSRGAINLQSEFDTFYNYYSALGWKNNKGAPIVSKVSAAAMWRLQGDCAANLSERAAWVKAFRNANTTNIAIWTAFDTLRLTTEDTQSVLHIHLRLSTQMIESLEDKCEKSLRALMAAYGADTIQYHCLRN